MLSCTRSMTKTGREVTLSLLVQDDVVNANRIIVLPEVTVNTTVGLTRTAYKLCVGADGMLSQPQGPQNDIDPSKRKGDSEYASTHCRGTYQEYLLQTASHRHSHPYVTVSYYLVLLSRFFLSPGYMSPMTTDLPSQTLFPPRLRRQSQLMAATPLAGISLPGTQPAPFTQ